MLNPQPMLRIRVIVLEADARAVLFQLGKLGVMELAQTPIGGDTAPSPPRDYHDELDRCHHLLERCETLRHALALPPFEETPGNDDGPDSPLPSNDLESQLSRIESRAAELTSRRQQLQKDTTDLEALCGRLTAYQELDFPLEAPAGFSFLHFITGTLPAQAMQTAQARMESTSVLIPLQIHEGRQATLLISPPEGRGRAEAKLAGMGFRPEPLPLTAGLTATSCFQKAAHERHQTEQELEDLNQALHTFAETTSALLAGIQRQLEIERKLLESIGTFPRTDTAVLLDGWVPAEQAVRLEQSIGTLTKHCCVITTTRPGDRDPVPILLHRVCWLRPFQQMTTTYGLPEYREVEPTLFVAISFVLMFGMMFGDAGQGALLALAGLAGLTAGRSDRLRDAGRILLPAGLSSIGFGILYGSYFGLPNLKHYALWHDPLEGNPLALMRVAVSSGAVLISLGLLLNISNRLSRRDWAEGLLGPYGLAGLLFYGGAFSLVVKGAALKPSNPVDFGLMVLVSLSLAGWLLSTPLRRLGQQRRGESGAPDGWVITMAESAIGLLEGVLVYLANTTSFVRLAAYAMSHAALLMAAFALATELSRNRPGWSLAGWLVIILGNLIALLLECLIAAVQALRLEYYEFFGKFYSGQGHPFRPFRL